MCVCSTNHRMMVCLLHHYIGRHTRSKTHLPAVGDAADDEAPAPDLEPLALLMCIVCLIVCVGIRRSVMDGIILGSDKKKKGTAKSGPPPPNPRGSGAKGGRASPLPSRRDPPSHHRCCCWHCRLWPSCRTMPVPSRGGGGRLGGRQNPLAGGRICFFLRTWGDVM